jgi:hypothetical protein
MSFYRIKTVKNRKYLYKQTSRRKGKKVLSIMEYIGALGAIAAAAASPARPGGFSGDKSTDKRANRIQENYERGLFEKDRPAFNRHVRMQHGKEQTKRNDGREYRESKLSREERRERAEAANAAQLKAKETMEAVREFNERREAEKEPPGSSKRL